ncbi:hypothetical protein T03_8015 [Trichinella britovi]|uniref:Apple domain-containing protein n=1 Tax=Trichinella britovi TaxID=45882 RepID=A0A0V1D2G1_TRIBR|nr:hypothetical protein T03_8015 [Trichinella britovi]
MYHHHSSKGRLLKMQKCYFNTSYLLFCAFCSVLQVSYSSEKKIYVPLIDKICLIQKIGIRQEFLNSIGIFLSAASFKYCIAYSYSDFSAYNYSIVVYNEKARSCSPLYDIAEENIIDNCSEQLHDLQFYKVTHCLPAEGFMYSFEEEVEENVNRINAVKLKATAEICIVERHPFSENFLLKRIGMLFLNSLELCLAHCRVLSVPGKCHAFRVNLCNAVYFEAEEKTCLHLVLNASQALYEYSESKRETVHFIEKCVEVEEQQEYQEGSAINRIQPDETSLSSPSRPISSTTHNVREQELDFFHYVAAENVKERYVKLYEFFEICEVQLLNIGIIRNAFAIEIPRKIYSLNRCLHICRRHSSCIAILFSQLHHQCKKIFEGRSSNSISVHAHEMVVALKECYKDRPDERKCNTEPLIYYFEETQEICAVEIYKQKNLTSWEVMVINKDVSNFQACLFKCIINNECCAINYFPTKECHLIKPADESHIFIVKDNSIFAEELYCESGTLVDRCTCGNATIDKQGVHDMNIFMEVFY